MGVGGFGQGDDLAAVADEGGLLGLPGWNARLSRGKMKVTQTTSQRTAIMTSKRAPVSNCPHCCSTTHLSPHVPGGSVIHHRTSKTGPKRCSARVNGVSSAP